MVLASTVPPGQESQIEDLLRSARSKPASKLSLCALPIVTGITLWLSFYLPWLVWVALLPFLLLIRLEGSRRWMYFGAWLGGLALFLPGTYWISYCAPWVWIGWLLLSGYLALYFPAFLLLARIANRRWRVPNLIAVPLLWVALEYVRMHLMTGFGWLMLAHNVYAWERTIQIADVGGVYAVSFVIAVANATWLELMTLPLFVFRKEGPQFNPGLSWRLMTATLIVFLNVGYGQMRVAQADFRDAIECILIQTNVPQDVKNSDEDREVFRAIWTITQDVVPVDADLVVWPETSYPYPWGVIEPGMTDVEISQEFIERSTPPGMPLRKEAEAKEGEIIRLNFKDADDHIMEIVQLLEKPLLVGSIFWDIQLSGARCTNNAILATPDEGFVGVYEKNHILPFGEFIPLNGNIPFLQYLLPYPPDMNYDSDAGTEVRALHYKNLHLAPLICFEDTIPDLTRAYMRAATPEEPVEILVNQSNDGWFDNSIEGPYHAAASVFRCVEARRPMVRASNRGLTCLVNGNGTVTAVLTKNGKRQDVDGWIKVSVPLDDRSSLYVTLGDWIPFTGLALAGVTCLLSFARQVGNARSTWRRNQGEPSGTGR